MSEGQTELPQASAFFPSDASLCVFGVCVCVTGQSCWLLQSLLVSALRSPVTVSSSHQSASSLVVLLLPAFCCSFIPSCHACSLALTSHILSFTVQGIFCSVFLLSSNIIHSINLCLSSVHLYLSWIIISHFHLNNLMFLLHHLYLPLTLILNKRKLLPTVLLPKTLIEWPSLIAEAAAAEKLHCNAERNLINAHSVGAPTPRSLACLAHTCTQSKCKHMPACKQADAHHMEEICYLSTLAILLWFLSLTHTRTPSIYRKSST